MHGAKEEIWYAVRYEKEEQNPNGDPGRGTERTCTASACGTERLQMWGITDTQGTAHMPLCTRLSAYGHVDCMLVACRRIGPSHR